MPRRCDGREMVCWIDSSFLNIFLPFLLNTGQLHTIWGKGDMDEFQGGPDGDEYYQSERRCNFSCVFFFTKSLLYQSINYFTVSVVNPFERFLSNWIQYCFSNNPPISTNSYHFMSQYSILVIHVEMSANH